MNLELWKKIKKEKKLTNQGISEISGVPKRTIENIFSGNTPTPRTDTVEAIEKALGIKEEQSINTLSSKEKEIVDLLMQLDDDKLEDALSVIKIIAKK